jgi:MFS family permease
MTTPSFLDPLRTRAWRRVWLTGLSSYVGTWMQVVGAQWLMGSLSPDGSYVTLLQAAASLPYLFLAVPAGVLGDVGSRRKLLISGQAIVAISAALLGVMTIAGGVTPAIVLTLTDIPAGAALDGASVAIARVIGPVLGGVAITVAAPAADFILNALLSAFSVGVLLRAGPMQHERTQERLRAALRSGVLYTRRSPRMRLLISEVATFSLLAGALWALLPNLGRGQLQLGAAGYGLLLGSAGIGATLAVGLLPILRRRSCSRAAAVGLRSNRARCWPAVVCCWPAACGSRSSPRWMRSLRPRCPTTCARGRWRCMRPASRVGSAWPDWYGPWLPPPWATPPRWVWRLVPCSSARRCSGAPSSSERSWPSNDLTLFRSSGPRDRSPPSDRFPPGRPVCKRLIIVPRGAERALHRPGRASTAQRQRVAALAPSGAHSAPRRRSHPQLVGHSLPVGRSLARVVLICLWRVGRRVRRGMRAR